MSVTHSTNQFISSGNEPILRYPDELTCTFHFGKNEHDYCKIKDEPREQSDIEEILRQQTDDKRLSTAAAHAAIMKIESELKCLCSIQVRNSDGSSTSVFNPTEFEHSIELPFDDTLQELLNDPQLSSAFNDDLLSTIPLDSIDQILAGEVLMPFQESSDLFMDQDEQYYPHIGMSTDIPSSTHDDTTRSSTESPTSDNERDEINRRGLKKSGGPLRKLARFGNKSVIKYSDEYHDRRVKNNEAVKKSRMKSKEKQKETEGKMSELANENRTLSDRVDLLMKELQVLKSLYKELNQDLPPAAVKALERVNVR